MARIRTNLRRTLLGVFAWMAIGLGAAGLIAPLVLEPPADLPPETATVMSSAPSIPPVADTTDATVLPSAPITESLCDGVVGTPQRVEIADLGIDAAIEVLGPITPEEGIGAPADKAKMGWQPSWPGVMPGACKGTVLMDAHTYGDGSAVFKEAYDGIPMSQLDKIGMVAKVATDAGDYYYRIDWQMTVLADAYPEFVKNNDIYDVDQSEDERIFFATCSDGGTTETIFTGYRIPPPSP